MMGKRKSTRSRPGQNHRSSSAGSSENSTPTAVVVKHNEVDDGSDAGGLVR